MTLIEIGRPQISGGCPYKILNSQWVPTRPEAMNVTTLHCDGSLIWLSFGFSLRTVLPGGSGSSDGGFSNMVDLIGDNLHVPSCTVFSKTRKSCFCIYIVAHLHCRRQIRVQTQTRIPVLSRYRE